jgi:hypothetical protein
MTAIAADELTDLDRRILAFEGQWWHHRASKDQAARDEFGVSAVRYSQMVNAVINKEAALREHPVLVRRLRRLRAQNRASRR